MCGINGIISSEGSLGDLEKLLLQMNDLVIHRGPDSDGIFTEEMTGFKIGMAMRRLAIIDLNTGDQPVFSDDRKKIIVFNGEIYNYKELKELLEAHGITFHTTSDTEVIIKLYEKFGIKAFQMLDGMFAFSIYDQSLRKVFIARDFFGEKPLYYCRNGNKFIWASELKSIVRINSRKASINKTALSLYFQLSYIPSPYTIYDGIYKLEPYHYLEIDCRSFEYNIKDLNVGDLHEKAAEINFMDKTSIVNTVRKLVKKSVLSRSVSDVPIGTFLSGGVDSSIVSLCLASQINSPINTFSIGFEKKGFDESEKARTVANIVGSDHHEFIISEKDLNGNLDRILTNFDEPFADSSSIASFIVAEKTRQYVKVALTGDGGDEVFGGYNKYYIGKLNALYKRFVPEGLHHSLSHTLSRIIGVKNDNRGARFKLSRLLKAIDYTDSFYYKIISLGFQNEELKYLLKNEYICKNEFNHYKSKYKEKINSIHQFRAIDRLISLEGDMLVKVDRTSMLASLECRAPFLNKELWNFSNQLPDDYLIKGWDKKHILKEAFKEYFPKDFLNKPKKGFQVPVGDWLRSNLRQDLLEYCEKSFIVKQGIFNYNYMMNVVQKHLNGQTDNTFRVWTYFCFQKWYKEVEDSLDLFK